MANNIVDATIFYIQIPYSTFYNYYSYGNNFIEIDGLRAKVAQSRGYAMDLVELLLTLFTTLSSSAS